jgi:hypothetical protein
LGGQKIIFENDLEETENIFIDKLEKKENI